MDREELEELVSAHLDGELSADEETNLNEILESSEEAQTLLESYAEQRRAFSNLSELSVPEGLKLATRGKLESENKIVTLKGKEKPWWLLVAGIAACAVLFVSGPRKASIPIFASLHMNEGALTLESPTSVQQITLSASGRSSRTFESPELSGTFQQGEALLSFECDAGTRQESNLTVKLSVDFDGDGQYDLVEERLVEIDDVVGFEQVTMRFGLDQEFDKKQTRSRAKLEFVGNDLATDGVDINFPQDAKLILPITLS